MSEITSIPASAPVIGEEQIRLLERLSNAVAVSGDEREVRAIVLEEIKDFVDEFKVDALGNVLAVKKARRENAKKVMISTHMDEVGFMIVEDNENGLYSFQIVGGIDEKQLPGKVVLVGKDKLPGVIGARPIHFTTHEEREQAIPLDNLRIDLGPGGGGKAKPGDRATFATKFSQVGPSLIGKALDNRLGVATLIELLKHAPDNITLQAAFTVQEEIGLRGAKVAAYAFNPDLAFAVDSTPAMDLPMWDGTENMRYNTRLGAGPAIYIADGYTLSDPRLVRYLAQTADSNGIPYQFRQPGGGGTDAGAIHKSRTGIPTISISISSRYAHTAALFARLDDWKNAMALLYTSLVSLPEDLLSGERR